MMSIENWQNENGEALKQSVVRIALGGWNEARDREPRNGPWDPNTSALTSSNLQRHAQEDI